MKKIIAVLLLAVVLLCLFTSCKGKGDDAATSEGYYVDDSEIKLDMGDSIDG
ncbi:MAG: hypothetical protein K6F09_03635 [Clostridiales bacterium]|nr:hypothetical protein [Clostridiales bacterium]